MDFSRLIAAGLSRAAFPLVELEDEAAEGDTDDEPEAEGKAEGEVNSLCDAGGPPARAIVVLANGLGGQSRAALLSRPSKLMQLSYSRGPVRGAEKR